MKRRFLILIFFQFFPALFFAQYNWQDLSNAPKSWRNDDIYFLTPKMGWDVHACYDYLTPTQFGQIYKTRDGGNS